MALCLLPSRNADAVRLSPDDEAAFDAYIAKVVRQYVILSALLMLLFILARWPLDLYVLPEDAVSAMAQTRICGLGVVLGTVVIFGLLKPKGRSAPVTAMLCYATFAGTVGYCFGRTGHDHAYLLANGSPLLIIPAALIPAEICARALGTACISTSLFLACEVGHPPESSMLLELARALFFASAMVFTIAIGEVSFRTTRTVFFERREAERVRGKLAHLTEHLRALVQERTEALRTLAQHLESVQENERRRIARDLHDDLGQSVTAMRYTVARLRNKLQRPSDAPNLLLLEDLSAILDGTAQTVRAVVATLSPRILEEHGLAAAAEWHVRRTEETAAIACELHYGVANADAWEHVEPRVALVAFRVIQEGTTNALKHADATCLEVRLDLDDTSITVEIRDNGVGFEASRQRNGFGLFALQERIQSLGGRMSVDSVMGEGTRLRAHIPHRGTALSASATPKETTL